MKKALALISSFAIITITPNGKIIKQVLGDSTFQIKSVAENIAITNGKIELNNTSPTNSKEDLVEILARANTNDLKIGSSGNNFTIEENGITALTSFPITIDPVKNELSVTTNSGVRIITILPHEATEVLTRGKFITTLNHSEINLNEDSKGELEYLVSGTKDVNIFNIASIDAKVSGTISASTGEILKLDEPQWLRIFGFIWK